MLEGVEVASGPAGSRARASPSPFGRRGGVSGELALAELAENGDEVVFAAGHEETSVPA